MGKLPPEIYTDRDTASGSSSQKHENNLRNIRGTFAAEGMKISKSTGPVKIYAQNYLQAPAE